MATVTADIDLGNDDDGLFMAGIFAAFAAKESGRRSAPVWRKHEQNAAAGLPHGPIRPFGYEPTRSPYASPKRWSFASWWTDFSPGCGSAVGRSSGMRCGSRFITVEKRKQILAHFAAHTRSGRRRALGTHLLSGMLWCGKCGNTLYSSSREATNHNSRRRYVACPAPIMVAAAG